MLFSCSALARRCVLVYVCVCVCVPQYTLFLLYASFAHSPRLQELLLGRCESSVHTAHTIYWFLRAFCLQGARITPVGVKAIEQVRASKGGGRAFLKRGTGTYHSLRERDWRRERDGFLPGVVCKLRQRVHCVKLGL